MKMVPDAFEILGRTLNIWDDDSALLYCLKKDGFVDEFITESTNSYGY
jgi:hypothetical protein